jgi:hypothetical protein
MLAWLHPVCRWWWRRRRRPPTPTLDEMPSRGRLRRREEEWHLGELRCRSPRRSPLRSGERGRGQGEAETKETFCLLYCPRASGEPGLWHVTRCTCVWACVALATGACDLRAAEDRPGLWTDCKHLSYQQFFFVIFALFLSLSFWDKSEVQLLCKTRSYKKPSLHKKN